MGSIGVGGIEDPFRPLGLSSLPINFYYLSGVNSGLIGPLISKVSNCIYSPKEKTGEVLSGQNEDLGQWGGWFAVCLDLAAEMLVKLSGTRWTVILFDLGRAF